jgi:hypothetical protein
MQHRRSLRLSIGLACLFAVAIPAGARAQTVTTVLGVGGGVMKDTTASYWSPYIDLAMMLGAENPFPEPGPEVRNGDSLDQQWRTYYIIMEAQADMARSEFYKKLGAMAGIRVGFPQGSPKARSQRQSGATVTSPAASAARRVAPFVRILAGMEHFSRTNGSAGTANRLAIQPGGGIEIPAGKLLKVSLQGDLRLVPTDGELVKQFRVSGGIVIPLGR